MGFKRLKTSRIFELKLKIKNIHTQKKGLQSDLRTRMTGLLFLKIVLKKQYYDKF